MNVHMTGSRCRAGLVVSLVMAALAAGACTATAPTPGPPEFPLVPCQLGVPGAPTAPPAYEIVAAGSIAFTGDAWTNVTPNDRHCGAQAVRGAASSFELSSFGGEDRIMWVATLARRGPMATPDPVPPTVTLFRLDASGPVVVSAQVEEDTGTRSEQYRMMGNYGHDAKVGSYLMRITAGDGNLLAEGRFDIVP
jgi:hypothetical protein